MYMMSVYSVCTCGGQERASSPLELELRLFVSYHVDLSLGLWQEQQVLTAEPALQPQDGKNGARRSYLCHPELQSRAL